MKKLLLLLLVATLSIGAGKDRGATRLRGDGLTVDTQQQQGLEAELTLLNDLIKQQQLIIGDEDPELRAQITSEFDEIEALEAHSPKQSKWERREGYNGFDDQPTRTPSPHQVLRTLIQRKKAIEKKMGTGSAPKTT